MLSRHDCRRDFAVGNQFSFSSPVSEHNEYGAWAENLKTVDSSFGKRDPHRKFGPWVRRNRLPETSVAYESDSLASSLPLWKSESPESRSNVSRAQLIAMHRQEMMDLVRDMPDTAYELSLKDIVESPTSQRMEKAEEEEAAVLTESCEMRRRRGRRRVTKTSTTDSIGFLLKLVMPTAPASFGGRQRENSCVSSKFSLRPIASATAGGDWESGERSSSSGSSNSGCSGGGRHRRKFGACYSFFYRQSRSRSREF